MSQDTVENDPRDADALPEPLDDVRSGFGADTAMQAMLRKRLTHANVDGADDAVEPATRGEGN